MDSESVTDRLTGEEAGDDVPREARLKADEGDRHVDDQHLASDPADRPITES